VKGGSLVKKPSSQDNKRFYKKAFVAISSFFGVYLVKFLSFIIAKAALLRYELTYKLHLNIRKYHDVLVTNSPSYKKVSEHPATKPVARATVTAFFVSLILFTGIQFVSPYLNIFRPGESLASNLSKTWNTLADFTNNNGGTGNVTITPSITGGTVTTDGLYTIHKFTSSGSLVVTGASLSVSSLVVGGGGGGGGGYNGGGGGGGAGGVVYSASVPVTPQTYTVTVGNGGAASTNGQSSVFSSVTALGGGGASDGVTAGLSGASGGGGGTAASSATLGGAGTQGYNGGNGIYYGPNNQWAGGGGGGAGAAGANASNTQAGAGGVGVANSITGASLYYGGGGGAGGSLNYALGGNGGGGRGWYLGGQTAGTPNTGGGGGTSMSGGSGVVIVRYLTSALAALNLNNGDPKLPSSAGTPTTENTTANFTAGTQSNTAVGTNTVYLLKPIGATAAADAECASGYRSGGVCANWGYLGSVGTALEGKQVYRSDLASGPYQWKTSNTSCVSPQCSIGLDAAPYNNKYSLVSPQVFTSELFTEYPTQAACKAIGGRLPTMTELSAIYTGRAIYGNNFAESQYSGYYLSATEVDSNYVNTFQFYAAGQQSYWKNVGATTSVRCVKNSSSSSGGSPGTFTSQVKDNTTPVGYSTLSWTETLQANTSITLEFRSGTTATPDGTWQAWGAVTNGGSLASFSGRYFQYRATLLSSNNNNVPTLNSVTVNNVTYSTSGSLGGAVAGNIGLRFDAETTGGIGNKAKPSAINWNGTTDKTSQKILFTVRAGDDQTGLDSSLCYGPSGSGACSSWWTNSGGFFSQSYNGADPPNPTKSATSILNTIGNKRYSEILVRFEGDGSNTPVLSDVTLTYDSIETPQNSLTTMYRSDGTTVLKNSSGNNVTAGLSAAWTSESTIKVKTTGLTCTACGTSTSRKIELQYNPVNTAFANESTNLIVGDAPDNSNSTVTIPNLAVGAYHFRIRSKDNEGRVSPWQSYGGNTDVTQADFSVEQTAPTGTVAINGGAAYATSGTVTLTNTTADTGGAGVGQMRFSETGTFDPAGTDWLPYLASKPWTLSVGDGAKTLYAQYRDNAGNVSGTVPSTTTDYSTGTRGTDIALNPGNTGVKLLKANGVAATLGTECVSGYVSEGVCATGPWLAGQAETNYPATLVGKSVYNQDLSGIIWKDAITDCRSPQCNTGLDLVFPSNYSLVSPQIFPSENFTSYPAQAACKALGGRLPRVDEIKAIYAGYRAGHYGSFTSDGWYYSATEENTINVKIFRFITWMYGATESYSTKNNLYDSVKYTRCIQDGSVSPGGSGTAGTFISPVKDMGATKTFTSVDWNTVTSPGTITMQVKAGNTATPDGTWTNSNGWTTVTRNEVSAVLAGKRYVQYQATLALGGGSTYPQLTSVTLNSFDKASITVDAQAPTVTSSTLTAPNGGEKWKGGSSQSITWNSGSIGDGIGSGLRTATPPIQLDYSTNGTDWTSITTGTANTGVYTWNPVPSLNLATVSVRLTAFDAVGNNASDVSDANFTIDSTSPTITAVSVTPTPFSPNASVGNKDTATITYTLADNLTGNANTTVRIYSGVTLVRILSNNVSQTQGVHTVDWDGKNDSVAFVVDGSYTYKVDATDGSGNSATQQTGTIVVDNTLPTANSISSITPNPNNTGNQTIVWSSFSDPAPSSGFGSYQLQRKVGSGGTFTDISDPNAHITNASTVSYADNASLAEGTYYYRVITTDVADNSVTGATSVVLSVDTSVPTDVTSLEAYENATKTHNITADNTTTWYPYTAPYFEWVADDTGSGIATYRYCLTTDSNCTPTTPTPGNSPHLTADLASSIDGIYYLRVVAVDNVGYISNNITTFQYNLDKSLPSAVTGFVSETPEFPDTQIKLKWNAVPTNSGAPLLNYKIERVEKSVYPGLTDETTAWSTLAGYAKYTTTELTFVDDALLAKQGQPLISLSTSYAYRISARDQSNPTYGNYQNAPLYALTRDVADPEVPPKIGIGKGATACDGTGATCDATDSDTPTAHDNTKGFSTKITWTAADDNGSGVAKYKIYRTTNESDLASWVVVGVLYTPTGLENTLWYDNDAHNDTTYGADKPAATTRLNDSTTYYYRITAVDGATIGNETSLVPASGDSNFVSPDQNFARTTPGTPDVTAPTVPNNVVANAQGLDNSNESQMINVSWGASNDYKARSEDIVPGTITYHVYRSTSDLGPWDIAPIKTTTATSFNDEGLADTTNYYYRVSAYDSVPKESVLSDLSETSSVVTYSSKVPSVPANIDVVTTKGDPNTNNAVGHTAEVTFTGSSSYSNKIVKYEVYRTTTNIAGNCNPGEKVSDCWVRVNTATKIQTINITPTPDDRTVPHTITDINLTDSTTYYYRVWAQDNTVVPNQPSQSNLFSGLSVVAPGTLHLGWDTTPDATAPALPSLVKVKDIHDDGTNFRRNIITWARIATPLRNGVNDFKEYKIYRSINDGSLWEQICQNGTTTILLPSCTTQYPNPLYDADKEIALTNNYYMDLIPRSQAESDKFFYYHVTASDDSGDTYKYNAPNQNTIINPNYFNESKPDIGSDGKIVSVSLNPYIAKPSILDQHNGLKAILTSVGVATATVTWTTDQDCDSMVSFRKSGSGDPYKQIGVGDNSRGLGMVQNHTVELFGLSPNTTYDYIIASGNALGNPVSAEGAQLPSLTTTGFNITAGAVSSTTSTTTIAWATNLDASSAFVEYQLQKQPGDDAQGGTAGVEPAALSSSPRNHKVVIKGLRSARTYTYKIKSISEDGYLAEYPAGEFATFKTKSFDSAQFTLAPASSNVAERNITATTAQIVWQTESPTTSWVDYSTTSGVYDGAAGNNDLVGSHVVVIEGLIPGTKYYYRVRVKDANEVEYTSQEYSFTAVLKPKISNMSVKDITPYSVTVAWETNVDTETIINWGTTTNYGEKKGTTGVSKVHQVKIENLLDNQEYHYQILAKDETGNEVADTDKIVRTPLDTEGPKITNAKVDILPMGENDTTSSIIVSWQTNKPASTQVKYGEGILGGDYSNESNEDTSLNNSHTVIIKGLKPASSYHYKMISKDKRTNITESQDYTFVTPTKEKSILQLILKSLEETFAWTGKLNQFFGKLGDRFIGK